MVAVLPTECGDSGGREERMPRGPRTRAAEQTEREPVTIKPMRDDDPLYKAGWTISFAGSPMKARGTEVSREEDIARREEESPDEE